MSTPEGTVKYKIKEYLKSLAPALWYFMPVPTGYGVRGIPDFVGCYKGRFFAIEAKAKGGEPKPWQRLCMDAINAAGGMAFLADDLDTVKRNLEQFKDAI